MTIKGASEELIAAFPIFRFRKIHDPERFIVGDTPEMDLGDRNLNSAQNRNSQVEQKPESTSSTESKKVLLFLKI